MNVDLLEIVGVRSKSKQLSKLDLEFPELWQVVEKSKGNNGCNKSSNFPIPGILKRRMIIITIFYHFHQYMLIVKA